jgi:hypothetical protein
VLNFSKRNFNEFQTALSDMNKQNQVNKICVGQSHFTKFSFCGKFSCVEMGVTKCIKIPHEKGDKCDGAHLTKVK